MSLLDVIKRATVDAIQATNPVNVLYGRVTKVNPLEIQIHQRLTLTSEFLILGRNVTDHELEMTVDHTTDNRSGGSGESSFASHNHAYRGKKKFTVHNALKTGERVILIRVQGGHQFVVLDRVVS